MTARWGPGIHRERRRTPRGSRDPIRVYLEEQRRWHRRRQLMWLVAAVAISVIVWAMVVTVLVTL